MSVSIAERVQYAYNAGFRDTSEVEGLGIIVAISLAECGIGSPCETGCNPDCCGCGCDSGCQSCGIWQIFQPCHPGTESCATDPSCCATVAWSLSHNTGFTAWSTYNNGAFKAHLQDVRNTIAGMPAPIGPNPAAGPPTPVAPTPTPAPPATTETMLAILLLSGAIAAGVYASGRGHVIGLRDDGGFGKGHVVHQHHAARQTPTQRSGQAFGSR